MSDSLLSESIVENLGMKYNKNKFAKAISIKFVLNKLSGSDQLCLPVEFNFS